MGASLVRFTALVGDETSHQNHFVVFGNYVKKSIVEIIWLAGAWHTVDIFPSSTLTLTRDQKKPVSLVRGGRATQPGQKCITYCHCNFWTSVVTDFQAPTTKNRIVQMSLALTIL